MTQQGIDNDLSRCVDIYPSQSLTVPVKKHEAETYCSHHGICQVSKPFHCHPQRSPCGLCETPSPPRPFFPFVARSHGQCVFFHGHSFFKRCVKYHWPYKTPGTAVRHVTGQPYSVTRFTHTHTSPHVCLWACTCIKNIDRWLLWMSAVFTDSLDLVEIAQNH